MIWPCQKKKNGLPLRLDDNKEAASLGDYLHSIHVPGNRNSVAAIWSSLTQNQTGARNVLGRPKADWNDLFHSRPQNMEPDGME